MNDTYKEILVKRKTPVSTLLLKFVMIFFTVLLILLGVLLWPALFLGLILGLVSYFVMPKFNVEYEYLYVNGSLDIDAIYSKQKRKKIASYDLDDMEILGPEKSHVMDEFRNNKSIKLRDFSSGEEHANCYLIVYSKNGSREMIRVEVDQDIVNDFRRLAPRKVNLY